MEFDIRDRGLAEKGKKRIEWALVRMPVLEVIRERFRRQKPLKEIKIGMCLHITTETASLAVTLKEAGAYLRLCASNPLSTQDDVAASLVYDYGIEVFAICGEDKERYYKHIEKVLEIEPDLTLDDGADLVSTIHKKFLDSNSSFSLPWAGTEETTTGVIRLKALEKEKKLLYPIFTVNDAYTKHLFDNRYGTGQSTLDGIMRATNRLIAGTVFVVCGYGWCGKGIAQRAKGLGAKVIVCEVSPCKALEAVMDGFTVLPIKEAAKIGDIFVTATGNTKVIRKEHFLLMKDKATLANSGHFNVEIDLEGLKALSIEQREVKPLLTEYRLKTDSSEGEQKEKRIYVLGGGRLVNLSCAEGHPAEVMDLSFANQALVCEYIAEHYKELEKKVYKVPDQIDETVAKLKLKTLGIEIDKLTSQQKKYLESWQLGT